MINLVIADDHVVLREALTELLEIRGNYNVIAQAGDGNELLGILKNPETHADLVILDVAMPHLDGVKTLEEIKISHKSLPVLILSASGGEGKVRQALKLGARGYLPKNAGLKELEFAIQSILEGKTYLSPTVTQALMNEGRDADPLANPLSVLTKREVEILALLADGKPNRDIAKMLHISIRTVDTHRSNILKKLKVRTNADLVKLAIQQGLITV
jgi:DNA-binding NarL/FixJ family response regulator